MYGPTEEDNEISRPEIAELARNNSHFARILWIFCYYNPVNDKIGKARRKRDGRTWGENWRSLAHWAEDQLKLIFSLSVRACVRVLELQRLSAVGERRQAERKTSSWFDPIELRLPISGAYLLPERHHLEATFATQTTFMAFGIEGSLNKPYKYKK